MFVLLLSFIRQLATKCICLNNQICVTRSAHIDSNPNEHYYWAFFG